MSRRSLVLAAALVVLGSGSPTAAATGRSPCEPSPEVERALERLSFAENRDLKEPEERARELTGLRSLLQRYPDDVAVHRRYQDAARGAMTEGEEALLAEYRGLLDSRPHDPRYLYLYARLVLFRGGRAGEARQYMEKALERDPNFFWAHYGLASIYSRTRERNREKARAHIERLMSLCPENLGAYDFIVVVEDRDFLAPSARKLRALLEKEKDASNLGHYRTLWDLEFRLRRSSEYAAVRKTVRRDLRRLRGVRKGIDADWFELLKHGYELAEDEKGIAWAEDQIASRYPHSTLALWTAQRKWNESNPYPREGPSGKKATYASALLEEARRWTHRWPDQPSAWFYRLQAVRDLPDVPADEVEITGAGVLDALERSPGTFLTWPPLRFQLAQVYLKNNVRVEAVPPLIEEGLREVEKETLQRLGSDDNSQRLKTESEANLRHAHSLGRSLLVEAHIRMDRRDVARKVLEEMEAALSESRPAETASGKEKRSFATRQEEYWESLGRLFEAEGRRLDALTAYQNALLTHPGKEAPAEDGSEETRGTKARRLWKELGGTDEGWEAWRDGRDLVAGRIEEAPEGPWEKLDRPLPDFALQDMEGRTWRLADLKGKTTLINVWATWCGPCRAELPYLQKLSERLRHRDDVLVLTMNVDSNAGLIEPVVRKERFTFPVIPAYFYVESLVEEMSIPRNWIVDPDGVIRVEQLGFGEDGDRWVEQVLQALERPRS